MGPGPSIRPPFTYTRLFRIGLDGECFTLAIPFDLLIPGYRNDIVNTLRLWSADATDKLDLEEFNAGHYADAVAAKLGPCPQHCSTVEFDARSLWGADAEENQRLYVDLWEAYLEPI